MPQTSPVISRVTLDADRTISSGSIRVSNILVANGTATACEVVFTTTAGTPILNIVVPSQDSEHFTGEWIADAGLKVLGLGSASVIVTVLHGQDGA